ncbi:MAG: FHA domain-containing protein [Pseudomonadota bacterium]|nr:FHA domain-containing protein [Pseudomonadota bacterium]
MGASLIALIGVLLSSLFGGGIAYLVAQSKVRADNQKFEKQFRLQTNRELSELRRERLDRKIDIAYKFAELNQSDPNTAETFLNEIAKETAIGYLYLDDDLSKAKVWIRNEANLLVGRSSACDIQLAEVEVSREHAVIHTVGNEAYVIPLNPTNPLHVNGEEVEEKCRLSDGDILDIYPYKFIYFQL